MSEGMWEWTKQPNVDREHFPASCPQDRLPWIQKEAKIILSYHQPSELLQFRKEDTNKRVVLQVPGSRKFEWNLSTGDIIRLYGQDWLSCTAATILPCKSNASWNSWNSLQKSRWLLWEKMCPVPSLKQAGNSIATREQPVQTPCEISILHW